MTYFMIFLAVVAAVFGIRYWSKQRTRTGLLAAPLSDHQRALVEAKWEGNVRELNNVITQALSLSTVRGFKPFDFEVADFRAESGQWLMMDFGYDSIAVSSKG